MNQIIAIPCTNPGGLDSQLGEHFGHCDLYTLVKAEDGKIADVEVIPNIPHQQGGCLAPVTPFPARCFTGARQPPC